MHTKIWAHKLIFTKWLFDNILGPKKQTILSLRLSYIFFIFNRKPRLFDKNVAIKNKEDHDERKGCDIPLSPFQVLNE